MILLGKSLTAIFGGGGGGDVVGAASSTDNAIARFDGVTGKVVQDSSVIIGDDGSVNIGGGTMFQTILRTKSSGNTWDGRIVAGGDNVAFLLGEYSGMAWLGAHNAELNGWASIYINPDSAGDVFIGGSYTGNPLIGVMNSYGKVGINTKLPTATLDVNGSARFRGDIIDSTGSAGLDGQVLKKVGGLVLWANP